MLEHIYNLRLVERNPLYALLLGIGYGIIGIGIAVLLFPEDPAIVAVAIISLIAYPTISSLMTSEEKIESKKKEFNILVFMKDHRNIFIVYILLFIGILLTFSIFSIMLPTLATNHIFENQVNVLYGDTTGKAGFFSPLFTNLLTHNFVVLTVIFMTSFLIGDGGLFLIIWNASVWGTIFGTLAKTAALNVNNDPFAYFLLILSIVTPHMLLEAFAYICSATTAGVISKALMRESPFSKKFNSILTNTAISLVFTLENVDIYKEIIRQSFL